MRASDPIFFASGAAALVYQVVWGRLLARTLGSDAFATGLVLALFMLGMALGAELGARLAARSARPQRLYAGLLFAAGAWAALSPWMLDALGTVDGWWPRALAASLVLLVPTVAMGATFAPMGRLAIPGSRTIGAGTASFYGANTLGAALGAGAAAFVLLPNLGFTGSLWAAAGMDVAAGAAALLWLSGAAQEPEAPRRAARTPLGVPWPLLLAPPLLGASSLALEVLFTRILISLTGASIYAFALVLSAFLLGLGLGARRGSFWLAIWPPRVVLGFCAFGSLWAALLGVALLGWRADVGDLFAPLVNLMPRDGDVLRLWVAHGLLAVLALVPTGMAFGLALPAAVGAAKLVAPQAEQARLLGRLYALNTLGAAAGALAAAFYLLPWLGPRWAFAVALVPALLAALCLPWPGPRLRGAVGLATVALAALVLSPRPAEGEPWRVLQTAHGPVSSASVDESGEGQNAVRSLRVDGKVVATTAPVDRRLQLVLGALPAWLGDEPKRALVVGLGTGMTAGALLHFPTIEEIRIVEISSAVAEVAPLFAAWNGELLEDPRTRLVLGDGRHALRLVEPGSFDVVTSDPIDPWTRGSADLYALEHFEAMGRALAPGGVASQWLPLYQLSPADVRTVVATWCAAFEHTAAYLSAYDLALIGSHRPLPGGLLERPLPPSLLGALAPLGLRSAAELVALDVAGTAELLAFADGEPPMREERPVLEFRAPKSFLAGYATEALSWAGRAEYVERLPAPSQPAARELRQHLARFLEELPSGWSAAAERYGAALLAPTTPP